METGTVESVAKPMDRLSLLLADDMAAVNMLIRDRMASEHAPRIPEVTAHLVEAGGKRLRPMLTLAAARLCGRDFGLRGDLDLRLAILLLLSTMALLLAGRGRRRKRNDPEMPKSARI